MLIPSCCGDQADGRVVLHGIMQVGSHDSRECAHWGSHIVRLLPIELVFVALDAVHLEVNVTS